MPFVMIPNPNDGKLQPAGYLRAVGQDDNKKHLVLLRLRDDADGKAKPIRKTVYDLTELGAVCFTEQEFKMSAHRRRVAVP